MGLPNESCTVLGVADHQWGRYALLAGQYLEAGVQPRVISVEELRAAITQTQNNPGLVCENPENMAQAAFVLGYLVEAESVDGKQDISKVHDLVRTDHGRFEKLVAAVGDKGLGKTLQRFAKDVGNVVSPYYCDHDFSNDTVPADQAEVLQSVIDRVRAARAAGKTGRIIVVFDIDDTVADMPDRTKRVMTEFVPFFEQQHPGELKPEDRKKILEYPKKSVGYRVDLFVPMRAGVPREIFRDFWFGFAMERFLSSDYARMDTPYPGAPEYVRAVHEAGATIVYLSARHEKSEDGSDGMLEGTLDFLRKYNFPAPKNRQVGEYGFPLETNKEDDVWVILKPTLKEQDKNFKATVADEIIRRAGLEGGELVAMFDNEPGNVMIFENKDPGVIVVNVGQCRGEHFEKPLEKVPQFTDRVKRIAHFQRLNGNGTKTSSLRK